VQQASAVKRHRFHSICPYFAMFPEDFVRRNLLAWSTPGDLVFDPFCGRGTAVFESLLNGRPALGCDANPVAVCISRAKCDPPTLASALSRLHELEGSYKAAQSENIKISTFFRICFHPRTLSQILFLRSALRWRTRKDDCFIAAVTLGCLHGESHRTEYCLSNRMPRTISTKPDYSVRWWQEHGCRPPERDTFGVLRAMLRYRFESAPAPIRGKVVEGDVRSAARLLKSYLSRVKLIVTSPPYLDITNYQEDQWLRLWFLGGPPAPVAADAADDRHRKVDSYWQFLKEAWCGILPLLHASCQIVVRIGGTRLEPHELGAGLLGCINHDPRRQFKLAECRTTQIKRGQKRSFGCTSPRSSVEHDFRLCAC